MSIELSLDALINATVDLVGREHLIGPTTTLAPFTVKRMGALTPPSLPIDGERYLVGTGATGDWLGHDGEGAQWVADPGMWIFLPVQTLLNEEDGAVWIRVGGTWSKYENGPAKVETVLDAAYTLKASDTGKYLTCVHATGCVITIPTQAKVGWSDYVEIHGRGVFQGVTFVTEAGVVLTKPEFFLTQTIPLSAWTLKREGVDKWTLIGYLEEE